MVKSVKARGLVLVGISAVLGVIAVAWVQKPTVTPMAGTKVVVATATLQFGDRLLAKSLDVVDFPQTSVPQGAFNSIDQVASATENRVALRKIVRGEPILAGSISASGGKATLSTVLDKDMRALTIRVNDVNGVAGFVQPSDRVDVLLTRSGVRGEAGNEHPQTDILIQNVKVLAIDQDSSEQSEKPTVAKAVTLEVTPDDAQKLTLGSSVGSLSLALRNATNPEAVVSRSLSVADLVPQTAAVAPPPAVRVVKEKPPAIEPKKIEIIRGVSSTTYELNSDGGVLAGSAARAPKLVQ